MADLGKFHSPTAGKLSFLEMVEEIILYMNREKGNYDIIVGCDSSSEENPHFPVAVVVIREGRGGRFFLRKESYSFLSKKVFNSIKERVLEEVFLSCQLAVYLREELKKRADELCGVTFSFQYIHADIGENGETKDMIKEVTALIKGNGFKPKIKPESFAASVIADKYT